MATKKIHIAKEATDKVLIPKYFKILGLFYFLIMALFIGYHAYYANKILPGVKVSNISLGGKTPTEAIEVLNENLTSERSVSLKLEGKEPVAINAADIGFGFLNTESVKNAFVVGRSHSFFIDLFNKLQAVIYGIDIYPSYKFDEDKLQTKLSTFRNELLNSVIETKFVLNNKEELEIVQGKKGESFNYLSAQKSIVEKLVSNDTSSIDVEIRIEEPKLSTSDLESIRENVEQILDTPFKFIYSDREWALPRSEILSFLTFKKTGDQVNVLVNERELLSKIQLIASEIDVNPRVQVLDVTEGKVAQFSASQNGLKLKIKDSYEMALKSIMGKNPDIKLAVDVSMPPRTENEFGIEELIAVGKSKFKGSIAGRVHNIELASSRLHGVLVPPQEEFSFNKSLGRVDKSTGYATAYVISGGRTVLGDGGGVCQVSTTLFRAVLSAGFPILERNAHSYRVSYYEQDSPPGMDATVYAPSVDFKFKNDSPNYILIASVFNKENATLEFRIYGKNDGREIKISDPKVLSRTAPPATIYEGDPNLAKGKTIQMEHAVWGASVIFNRTVTKNGETLYEDTFKSNYRAWPAVYKVGERT